MMGLLTMGNSLGILAGPLLAGIIIALFSIGTTFTLGVVILGAGTVIFARNQWT